MRHGYSDEYLRKYTVEEIEQREKAEEQREKERRRQRRAYLKQRRADGALVLEMLAIGRRSVAKRFHPDLGGSTEAMLHLNQLHDEISAYVKLLFGIKAKR